MRIVIGEQAEGYMHRCKDCYAEYFQPASYPTGQQLRFELGLCVPCFHATKVKFNVQAALRKGER